MDGKWRLAAEKYLCLFEDHENYTSYHDFGFVFNCSYGNGYRLTKDEAFRQILIAAGDSLIARFNPTVGSIKNWGVDKEWQSYNKNFTTLIFNILPCYTKAVHLFAIITANRIKRCYLLFG